MAQKVTIVIPNFNGRKLLERNIPILIKNADGVQIIVVDDGSSDDSVDFLKKNFKQIKIIVKTKNTGFAHTVNTGVKAASGDLVLLLNSDVSPRPNFLTPAIRHFKDKSLFSVGLADYSHENGKIVVRGRGGATFKNGFLSHFAISPQAGESLWTSGGSSLIDKKKFQEIGGFDLAYAPFYWEDIDLCWRARQKGYLCLFEPNSKVDHFHEEGAIKKHFKNSYIKSIAYKNQFIFVWKNISDPRFLFEHIAWLPYHAIKAIIGSDWAFFTGFLKAILTIPKLIFDTHVSSAKNQVSDRGILKPYEKQ